MRSSLGPMIHSFIEQHLKEKKRLQPASIRSYRDALRLFLTFIAEDTGRPITQLVVEDLTFERSVKFLHHLEEGRSNNIRTRNHRLAVVRSFFEYLATRSAKLLPQSQQVISIRMAPLPKSPRNQLSREEIIHLLRNLPRKGSHALRDGALVLFLYNTGARTHEIMDVRVSHLDLDGQPRVLFKSRGEKWRSCPLWLEMAAVLRRLLEKDADLTPNMPLFRSRNGSALTRFGIYKILRRHTILPDMSRDPSGAKHVFRHKIKLPQLDAGLAALIRSWLAAVTRGSDDPLPQAASEEAPPPDRASPLPSEAPETKRSPQWKDDQSFLGWLNSL